MVYLNDIDKISRPVYLLLSFEIVSEEESGQIFTF